MVFSLAALALAHQLSGRILLAVEDYGRAWYVNPVNEQRYSLGSPDEAFAVMRQFGLGITNKDLDQIINGTIQSTQQSTHPPGDMAKRLSGRILLQVEEHGEAWYVVPGTLRRYYLGRPADALRIMSEFGLGITNANLAKVPVASGSLLPPSRGIEGVAFTSQAPLGEWSEPRQQEGCEEASAFMAVKWAQGESFTLDEAKSAIVGMSDWEKSTFGTFMDTSITDTAERLIRQYQSFINFEVKKNIGIDDIRAELNLGRVVLIAVNGTKLENPNFTNGGPLRHMMLVTGFDASTNEFISHDPGTSHGASYRYSASTIQNALMDYPSGDHAPLMDMPTAMIAVWKN